MSAHMYIAHNVKVVILGFGIKIRISLGKQVTRFYGKAGGARIVGR